MRAMIDKGEGTLSAVAAAQQLTAMTGFEIGRNRLIQWLRDARYIKPDCNHAYQRYVDAGYFRNATIPRGAFSDAVTHITQAGIKYLGTRIATDPLGLKKKKALRVSK